MRKEILRLAVPAVVANITTPLLGLFDTAIAGHLQGAGYIAAIAVGGTIFNMLYWMLGFLRMGTSGFTATAYGAGDRRAEWTALYRSLFIGVAVGVAFILLRQPMCYWAMRLISPDAIAQEPCRRYFLITIWGAPAFLATMAMTGWLLGMQNARAGMWISIVVNVANIAVSLLLVVGVGLQIEGIAVGTLSAQWIGAAIATVLCLRYRPMRLPLSTALELAGLARYFKVNIYIFLRTLCIIAVTVWFTHSGATQGTLTLAANALLMQLFILFSYMMDALAYAGEAITGKYLGAGDSPSLRRAVATLFRMGTIGAILFSLLYLGAGEWFISLLTEDQEVTREASRYIMWAVAIPLVSYAAFVWDGIFIGSLRTGAMLLSIAISTALYFILYLALTPTLGNHALWLAFLSYLLSRGLIQTLLYRRHPTVKT